MHTMVTMDSGYFCRIILGYLEFHQPNKYIWEANIPLQQKLDNWTPIFQDALIICNYLRILWNRCPMLVWGKWESSDGWYEP